MDWALAHELMRDRARAPGKRLTSGQRASLWAVAERLNGGAGNESRGVIIADDVGMGKTRVATAVAAAVREAGGRVAIVIPAGLRFQWHAEMRDDGLVAPPFLHTLDRLLWVEPGTEDDPATANVILASHGFTNWRMGGGGQGREGTHASRWGLLPALIAEAAIENRGRAPQGYAAMKKTFYNYTAERAQRTYQRLLAEADSDGLKFLRDLADRLNWTNLFCEPKNYTKDADNRWRLERAIGLNLGRFDLIIIDEAHKSRAGEEAADVDAITSGSALSRLLKNVLQVGEQPARLALTATPLALSPAQWLGTLGRIGTPAARIEGVGTQIANYVERTDLLRGRWRSSPRHVDEWIAAASAFEAALTPYVVRRDKSEVTTIRRFRLLAGAHQDYRRPSRERITPATLSPDWRRVILAAEGLSAAVSGTTDPLGKRLRTTLANGHGIATLVHDALGDTPDDGEPPPVAGAVEPDEKQVQRAMLWRKLIVERSGAQVHGAAALYDHPLVLAAATTIERDLRDGHKVLVFGRFTAGMTALHDLLNARGKLAAASGTGLWPAESLGLGETDDDGVFRPPSPADLAAARQLGVPDADFTELARHHAKRWRKDRNRRRWWAEHALELLGDAVAHRPGYRRASMILGDATADSRPITKDGRTSVGALVARAVRELMSDTERDALREGRVTAEVIESALSAFRELISAALDADRLSDDDEDGNGDSGWDAVRDHLVEAFAPGRSTLARLLHGGTRYPTRRLLQAAFNRRNSFPNVLIAQSVVGREGLNLHEACRVVLQFHPEWNPGVEEQQIGRVDRYRSRWQLDFDSSAPDAPPDQLPRIEVRSIVFGGTYDEHHWRVLDARRSELRAHLHGEVLLTQEAAGDPDALAIVERVNAAAPRFTPPSVPELAGLGE